MSSKFPENGPTEEDLRRLLARVSVVRSACELDLLIFLHRHPRTLLTNEQLAALVGYDMKQTAAAIDAFIDGGILQRTQNPIHAARMYLLTAEGPKADGVKSLVEIASTRSGRQNVIRLLAGRSHAPEQAKRRLHAIA